MTKFFKIKYTDLAKAQFNNLEKDKSKQVQYKAVAKALARMEQDLRHPALNTHEYSKLSKTVGYKVFESYAQNNSPAAYRIFWRYGPDKNIITIIAIPPHP